MSGKGGGKSGRGDRALKTRVKTAKGRRISSTRWLQRQLNDPYVIRAKKEGYRGRAAFKLIEIDDRYHFLFNGARVVDLGCAPGGWCQVAVARTNADGAKKGKPQGFVLGVDIQEVEHVAGAEIMQLDFLEEEADLRVRERLDGPADVVLSDMAAPASGHKRTDHLKIMALAEAAAHFAFDVLAPGGAFAAKVLQGGTENELLALLKQRFEKVMHFKPPSSRKDSSEMFVVATGFRPEHGAEEEGDAPPRDPRGEDDTGWSPI